MSTTLADPGRLRAVLAEPARDLAGEVVTIDLRIQELRKEESGLTCLGATLDGGNDVLESVLTELREQRRGDECKR